MNKIYVVFLLGIGLIAAYVANLTKFPIFADEAIYLNWAHRIILGQESPFISMVDGKPPLYMWLAGFFSLIFHNQLLAGRLVSVIFLVLFCVFIARILKPQVSKVNIALILLLITLSPFCFFYGRMALLDMAFSTMLISGVLVWTYWKTYRGALLTGSLLALAFWFKTPALFLLPFPLLTTVLFDRKKERFLQAGVATVTVLAGIAILRISIWFPSLFSRAEDFTYSWRVVLQGQLSQIPLNLVKMTVWLNDYLTPLILILAVIAVWKGFQKNNPLIKNLLIALVLFIAPLTILGKTLTPRYYLPAGLILLLLAGLGLEYLPKKINALLIGIFLIVVIPWNWVLVTNPLASRLPQEDTRQYLMDWSSGIGIAEGSQFFQNQAKNQRIKIMTEGYFGTLPDALFVYMDSMPEWKNIEIVGVGSPYTPNFVKEASKNTAPKLFYIGNRNRIEVEHQGKMQLLTSFPKVNNGAPLDIYEVPQPLKP